MLELRCPACGRANAVLDEAGLDAVRCAECAGALDDRRQVRYRVAGPGRGWGSQVYSDLLFRVAGGTLGPRMRLSEEGGPWFRAGEREDLFAAAPKTVRGEVAHAARHGQKPLRVQRSRAPRATRTVRVAVPGSVGTMAGLCKTLGIVVLLLAVGGFFLAASLGAGGGGMTVFVVLVALGWGQLAIGSGLQRASVTARNAQLGLAVIAVVFYLYVLGVGAGGMFLLLGGMFVAIPFFLLLNQEAKAWFAGTWRERGR